jgi:hypothetical protein
MLDWLGPGDDAGGGRKRARDDSDDDDASDDDAAAPRAPRPNPLVLSADQVKVVNSGKDEWEDAHKVVIVSYALMTAFVKAGTISQGDFKSIIVDESHMLKYAMGAARAHTNAPTSLHHSRAGARSPSAPDSSSRSSSGPRAGSCSPARPPSASPTSSSRRSRASPSRPRPAAATSATPS